MKKIRALLRKIQNKGIRILSSSHPSPISLHQGSSTVPIQHGVIRRSRDRFVVERNGAGEVSLLKMLVGAQLHLLDGPRQRPTLVLASLRPFLCPLPRRSVAVVGRGGVVGVRFGVPVRLWRFRRWGIVAVGGAHVVRIEEIDLLPTEVHDEVHPVRRVGQIGDGERAEAAVIFLEALWQMTWRRNRKKYWKGIKDRRRGGREELEDV